MRALFDQRILRPARKPVCYDRSMSWRAMFRPGMRAYFIPLVAGLVLAVSAFLPWVVVGDVALQGCARHAGPLDRRSRRPGGGARDAQPDHPQELTASAAGDRPGRARHHVPVVADHAADRRRARARRSPQAFAIVEGAPMGDGPRGVRRQRHLSRPRRVCRPRRLRPDDRRQARVATPTRVIRRSTTTSEPTDEPV